MAQNPNKGKTKEQKLREWAAKNKRRVPKMPGSGRTNRG